MPDRETAIHFWNHSWTQASIRTWRSDRQPRRKAAAAHERQRRPDPDQIDTAIAALTGPGSGWG
jgi:hypothetical protein